ncbi:MAG: hypothetical protein DRJ52_03800 [Thermoprotei archaeon]|nr:MAG: hypothetical protein DRJ52_03800 [Thermoprotei archaeon]RLE98481.1 MAG: hypothetical protein DRJ63_07600 [Thermoprotei archaeon]HDI75381.1 CPBP family intramembrane metalloprotease [Thermoprotei archaeon]
MIKANVGKGKALLVIFTPFILNMICSNVIAMSYVAGAMARGVPPEKIGILVAKAIFTYNFYWSVIQVGWGLYVVKLLGGWDIVKEKYSISDISEKPSVSIALIIALILLSQGIIMSMQYVNCLIYYQGSWEKYLEYWHEITSDLPLFSKIYFIAIAPFTAGIFEEIIWRLFGIEVLEKYFGSNKALIVQALAFAIWHGFSLHTIATFIIGLIYGYTYLKRRKLLVISTAHVITDIIGFTFSIVLS